MLSRELRCSRRKFLASAAALTIGGSAAPRSAAAGGPSGDRRPIAVLGSVYRPLSYLYHLAGRFLHGYPRDGQVHIPRARIDSLWLDQIPENDMSGDICRSFAIRRARTVRDALFNNENLAVEGVLIVLEHGNYERNERGQILYPRAAVFDQVAELCRAAGRSVPVFIAKHLSYSFAQAEAMIGKAKTLQIPLMAGSALPAAKEPDLGLEAAPIREALVAGYGPIEVYGFDALEALQALIEKRAGSETGVAAVRCLSGAEVWRAGDRGVWSWELLQSALARGESVNLGDVRDNAGTIALPGMPAAPPIAFVIEYRDGTRGTVLLLNGHLQEFVAAVRVGEARTHVATRFATTPAPGMHQFNAHAGEIDRFLETSVSPPPIERTLLTSGVLERLLESHSAGGRCLETPELDLAY